jgi:hypothetical protein
MPPPANINSNIGNLISAINLIPNTPGKYEGAVAVEPPGGFSAAKYSSATQNSFSSYMEQKSKGQFISGQNALYDKLNMFQGSGNLKTPFNNDGTKPIVQPSFAAIEDKFKQNYGAPSTNNFTSASFNPMNVPSVSNFNGARASQMQRSNADEIYIRRINTTSEEDKRNKSKFINREVESTNKLEPIKRKQKLNKQKPYVIKKRTHSLRKSKLSTPVKTKRKPAQTRRPNIKQTTKKQLSYNPMMHNVETRLKKFMSII